MAFIRLVIGENEDGEMTGIGFYDPEDDFVKKPEDMLRTSRGVKLAKVIDGEIEDEMFYELEGQCFDVISYG